MNNIRAVVPKGRTTMKAGPLKFHGGKSYLAPWIQSLAPSTEAYTHRCHPFAGGLGELWSWPCKGVSETVNDLDSDISNFWSTLRSRDMFPKLQELLNLTPFSERQYAHIKEACRDFPTVIADTVAHAWAFFIQNRMSRQGLGKSFATPTTRTRRGMNENVSAWLSAVETLPEFHERLQRVEVRNMDAVDFIRQYDHPGALFYCDPPYFPAARQSTGQYKFEYTEIDHRALLEQLEQIQGMFMLSGYHFRYADQWADANNFYCHEREIDNKASGAATKPKMIECLWTNYEAPQC